MERERMEIVLERPWSLPAEDVAGRLAVDPNTGLAGDEATRRLQRFGPNRLEEAAGRGPLRMLLSQFADLMIGLLVVAAAISASIGEWADSILIAVIVVANAVIGFVQEWRAEKAVAALKKLSKPTARVWRDGRLAECPAAELVPGDVIKLVGGDFAPADARLIVVADLQTDEAALTGESLSVEKSVTAVEDETTLPDRRSMIYTGTAVTQGHGRAVVAATGMQTELGHIATLLEKTETTQTPLQRRLAVLSKRLAIVVIAVSIFIFAAGVLREEPDDWNRELFSTMLLTAVSLAVAAIPEGLPAVITVALSLGSQRMAARKAIIRRLSAVETLGSVDVICSDKTGTLTQNRMKVAELLVPQEVERALEDLLRAGVLCNDAELSDDGEFIGSATESAILESAVLRGIEPEQVRAEWPRLDEIPFSSDRKQMTTLHSNPAGRRVLFVKGAVERVVSQCTTLGPLDQPTPLDETGRDQWLAEAETLATRGQRVLALAVREWDGEKLSDGLDDAEIGLSLLGLVSIVDPVRPEARDAIAVCRSAGIRTVMITGDHRGTARAIAEELQLFQPGDEVLTGSELDRMDDEELKERAQRTSVYARVSPEHKLRIVRAQQSHGRVVSMTGDGVNDAPALKQADIGVAMGITGTDVAKEAAEMVLADDNFSTIVAAVEEGRVVYDNIRKFVGYLLTANAGEILVLVFAIAFGLPLPLLPVHILWINLVTDGLPALALGFEPAERNIMKRQPRPRRESIFAGGMSFGIVLIGLLTGLSCIGLFQTYLTGGFGTSGAASGNSAEFQLAYARSIVFFTLSMSQLFYVLSLRSSTESFFSLGLLTNYRLTGAVLIGTAMQLAVIYAPPLQPFFHTVPLAPRDLGIGLIVSCFAFVALEAWKLVRKQAHERN